MDLRERKTRRSIREAFLELLAAKPLERITVKELAARAEISKATFYLHYHSVFDLSEALQRELVDDVVTHILAECDPLTGSTDLVVELFEAFDERRELVDLLISRNGSFALAARIEDAIRERILEQEPSLRDDVRFNTLLTYQVQGGYWAYSTNRRKFQAADVVGVIAEASSAVTSLMR